MTSKAQHHGDRTSSLGDELLDGLGRIIHVATHGRTFCLALYRSHLPIQRILSDWKTPSSTAANTTQPLTRQARDSGQIGLRTDTISVLTYSRKARLSVRRSPDVQSPLVVVTIANAVGDELSYFTPGRVIRIHSIQAPQLSANWAQHSELDKNFYAVPSIQSTRCTVRPDECRGLHRSRQL